MNNPKETKIDAQKDAHPKADPFSSLENLRIGQNFGETLGAKKAILNVPVRKPTAQEFFRVHPDENMRLQAAVIELKEERESFIVTPSLASQIPGEVKPKLIVTVMNRQGVLFLWPVGLDLETGQIRKNHWNESARSAAHLATKGWVRMVSNMSLGAYEVFQATASQPEPEWPDLSFLEILRLAFKDNFIDSGDHIVLRKLRGES